MKKIVSVILALIMSVGIFAGVAAADGKTRVVFGKDLTDKQQQDLLEYFELKDQDVVTLYVTIDEERAWLGNLLPAEKIGSHSLSSICIKAAAEGSGLDVKTKNINWITPEMYMAALTTAGIVDADIKIAAPTPVSGTAALCGVFKAYEDITGITLSRDAKEIAAQELVLTGKLADLLGAQDATSLVNQLKTALDSMKGKSDDEIREIIKQTAKDNNVSVNDAQVDQLLNLVKRLMSMNIDPDKLMEQAKQLQAITDKLGGVQKTAEGIGGWFESVWNDFTSWLKGIFG
jgi:uncharacterized protein YpuA (DUF1002 family)